MLGSSQGGLGGLDHTDRFRAFGRTAYPSASNAFFCWCTLAIRELDGRFLHNHISDPESDCGTLLASTPASQWYKIHPPARFNHEVAVLNSVLAIPELDGRLLYNPCSDPGSDCGGLLGSTLATQRYKGPLSGIKLRKSLTFVRVVFIDSTLAIPELNSRSLYNCCSNPESDCRRSLGSTRARQWYKVRLWYFKTHESANPSLSGH